jgi:hypothetical protein
VRRECASFKVGTNLLKENIGLFRVFQKDRAAILLHDMDFHFTEFLSTVAEYATDVKALPAGHAFRSCGRRKHLLDFRVMRDPDVLEAALRGRARLRDWTVLSLRHYMSHGDAWKMSNAKHGTVLGHSALALALKGWGQFHSVFWDESFLSVNASIITLLEAEDDPLLQYPDVYLRYQLEMMQYRFTQDVFRRKVSDRYPDQSMKGPAACAELYGRYVQGFLDEVKTGFLVTSSDDSWFVNGEYPEIVLDNEPVRQPRPQTPPPSRATTPVKTTTPPAKTTTPPVKTTKSVSVAACGYDIGRLLNVTLAAGGQMTCRNAGGCTFGNHRPLAQISRKEAENAVKGAGMRAGANTLAKLEKAIQQYNKWKK